MDYIENYNKWLNYNMIDKKIKSELVNMKNDDVSIKDSFYTYLEFGTAGMRGIMGAGTNRMNIYTIRRASKGLADFIISKKKQKDGVCIIYDTRNNSKLFAMEVAKTLIANKIKIYISKDVRPTPFLSYAIRKLKTYAGVNITASHNSKEYNGMKIYLDDGAQFSYPFDYEVSKYVNNIDDLFSIKTIGNKECLKNPLFNYISKKVEDEFVNEAVDKLINKKFISKYGKKLKIVYTPLHGTGYVFLKDAFKKAGFNVNLVKEQNDKNGDFKTVKKPNPEDREVFELSINLAKEINADIIIATDPDCDRFGIMVKNSDNEYVAMTGNEIASVMLFYLLHFRKKECDFNNCYVVSTFVTTRFLNVIAKYFGIDIKITPTGFKWIGKTIKANANKKFLFGAEESYGVLISDYVRDKDAVSASLFVSEIATLLKENGYTILDMYNKMKEQFGTYKNYNVNYEYKGYAGFEIMNKIMNKITNDDIKKITDIKVLYKVNYNDLTCKNIETNEVTKFEFEKTNNICFELYDDSKISIRPSGTEPKIKVYYDIKDINDEWADNKFEILNLAFSKILKEDS